MWTRLQSSGGALESLKVRKLRITKKGYGHVAWSSGLIVKVLKCYDGGDIITSIITVMSFYQ